MSGRCGGKYWSVSTLAGRGWTKELIRELLPKPHLVPNHNGMIRTWAKSACQFPAGSQICCCRFCTGLG